jgi:hypothetical protein
VSSARWTHTSRRRHCHSAGAHGGGVWDLPSLAAGATALLDATITGARVGDLAQASLATISRFFELDATTWSNNTVRSLTRNVSNTTIDLARPPYRYRL